MIVNSEITNAIVEIYKEILKQQVPDIETDDFEQRVKNFREKLDNARRRLKRHVIKIKPGRFHLI